MKWMRKLFGDVAGNLPVDRMKEYFQTASNKDVESTHGKSGYSKQLWGPFRPIPNVREFRVEVSEWDRIFLLFGMSKRLKQPKLIYKPYVNKFMNRYMEHQLRRMHRCAKHEQSSIKFWRIGMHLVRRSNIFLVMAINHIFPRWHREMSMRGVIRLAIETRRIANQEDSKLDFRRVYIEKSNGRWRPLGVPSPAWRIYMHMMAQLISFYLDVYKLNHNSQHGFRVGRGTSTAWYEILTKVIHSKDIFEFDLKSFFDTINLDAIAAKMISKGFPVNIVQRLYYLNTVACQVKPPYRLNEFEHMMKRLLHQNASFDEIVKHPRPLSYMYRVRGVPQGAPTSPILSTMVLEGSIMDRPGLNTLMYADDGLYYGDTISSAGIPIITPNSGITTANIYFNHSKSEWVKRGGTWLKPLKFLGLEYNGVENTLRASTRNGSHLIYDKQDMISILAYRDELSEKDMSDAEFKEAIERLASRAEHKTQSFKGDYKSQGTFEEMVKSKYYGWIVSRLYYGSWDSAEFIQSFEMKYIPKSYMASNNDVKINVFNSTSFACEWLVKKLRNKLWTKHLYKNHIGKQDT